MRLVEGDWACYSAKVLASRYRQRNFASVER